MSARRRLVSCQQHDAPLPVRRPHQSDFQSCQPPPPYEPPTFPLTETVRRSLGDLQSGLRKYEKEARFAIQNIIESKAQIKDQLYESNNRLKTLVERRESADGHLEKTEEEERAEKRVQELEEVVKKLTADSEKATGDLIDYICEMVIQKTELRDVSEAAAAAWAMGMTSAALSQINDARRPRRRQVDSSISDDDATAVEEMDEDVPEADAAIPPRYVMHNALYPEKNVLHSSTWFPSKNTNTPSSASAGYSRRRANYADHIGNDDDEDIQITGTVSSLRCPISLQLFKEPYSNAKCRHTFEKSAILQRQPRDTQKGIETLRLFSNMHSITFPKS
jgi:E3 SUMO-protein ligase NSE2